ncbi:MAG: DsbA family protein [Candidatus Omnitrophota bacterium]
MRDKVLIGVILAAVVAIVTVLTVRYEINQTIVKRLVVQQEEILDMLKKSQGPGGEGDLARKLDSVNNRLDTVIELASGRGPRDPQPQRPPKPPAEDYSRKHDIPTAGLPVKGAEDAEITIVGFLDLQCPFSARFQPAFDEALKAYPDKVNYVVKHFPLAFHPQAVPAAKAVIAAGQQGKYFEMLDLILENNRQLSEEKYVEFADQLGLDTDKFMTDMEQNAESWEELIQQDYALGQKVDVRGTPTFYIDGYKTGARSVEAIKKEIEERLGEKE